MGLFEHWPYANFHDLNLDWIIRKIKNIETAEANSQASAEASAESAAASQLSADASQASADAAQLSAESAQQSASDSQESAEASAAAELSAKNYVDHIADPVSGLVTSWLTEHITNPTNPPIDTSLSVAGAAADAKATGDELNYLKTEIGYKLVNVVDTTQYISSNSAVTYNGDGTYTIGTSDYGTTTFNNGKYAYIDAGEYELYGVSNGAAFIAPSNNFSSAVFSNDTPNPKRITITEEDAGYLYFGFYIGSRPSSSFVIEPYLKKTESNVSDNKQNIDDLNRLTENTYNLASFEEQVFRKNGVLIKAHEDGTIELNGTATANNRTNYLKTIQLSPGNYRLYTKSDNSIVSIIAYNADNNAFISSGGFTLAATTNVGLAFSFDVDREYDEKLLVSLVKSDVYVKPIKAKTAIDELARVRLDAIEAVNDAPYNLSDVLSVNTKTENAWTQGACAINGKSVGFNASSDDHSTTADYIVCDIFDFSTKHIFRHNLGHCASADYNVKTDTMMVGNGAVSTSVLPTMYLVSDMLNTIDNGSDILVSSPNVTEIDLSSMGGSGLVCCFGESECFAYAITADGNNKNFFKLLLGMGENNMLSLYPQDSYGTFISGREANEYNGTAHVLKKITVTNVPSELQGLKYRNGRIIMPTDENVNSRLTSFISVLKMNDDSILIENNLWIPVTDTLGNQVRTECEDVIFSDGQGYVVTRSVISGTNVFMTHQFTI